MIVMIIYEFYFHFHGFNDDKCLSFLYKIAYFDLQLGDCAWHRTVDEFGEGCIGF